MKTVSLIAILVFLFIANSCKKEDFSLGTYVHDIFWLINKGAKMPVHVKGNTKSKTFVILLHGGPGATSLGYTNTFQDLESDYAFVYWDQRNSGFSQGSFNQTQVIVPNFIEDLHKLILLLKSGYGNDIGIFLIGHSWGGYLGTAYLGNSNYIKQNLKGWIDIDGVHDFVNLQAYVKRMIIQTGASEIAAGRNVDKWNEKISFANNTNAVNPDRNTTMQWNKHAWECQSLMGVPNPANNNPLPILFQVSAFLLGRELDHERFVNDFLNDSTVRRNMNNINVPSLLIWGQWDFPVPPAMADDAYNRLTNAPYKHKVILPDAGHNFDGQEHIVRSEVKIFIERFK